MVGQNLGHYKILEKLGAGGMGEVYRAEDGTLDREVALKVLPAGLADSQERLERFQREAHTLAALDHPNIVHIYSVESEDDVHFLTMQLVLGTVPYMSPEQVQGQAVDHRTDLFSLGILLYEMLCGSRPFSGQNTASLVSAIMRDEPPAMGDLKQGLPALLVELVEGCLEKDPKARIQSASEIRDRLTEAQREVQSGQIVPAQVSGARPRALKILLPGLLIGLAVILGVMIWRKDREPAPEAAGPQIDSLVVLPLQNLSGDPDQDYFVDGMTEALITDLSKISALKVISRTSAMRYKGSDKALAKIAEELDVDAVIEGSVIREGDEVGVTAQLVEVATDQCLWAERYKRELTSILELQGEVAQAIAREIRVTLTPSEATVLTRARAVHPEAQAGYTGAMVAAAEALVARSNPAYSILIARSYVYAGERERALSWLEEAYEARMQNMIYLRVNPIWDPLREEPRFQELQRRMNFPE